MMNLAVSIRMALLVACGFLVSCSEGKIGTDPGSVRSTQLNKNSGNAYPYGIVRVELRAIPRLPVKLVGDPKLGLPFTEDQVISSTLTESPMEGIEVDLARGIVLVNACLLGVIDVFSVEYQTTVNGGMTYRVDYEVEIMGDFNRDRIVNYADFDIFKGFFNTFVTDDSAPNAQVDLFRDKKIDARDFVMLRYFIGCFRR